MVRVNRIKRLAIYDAIVVRILSDRMDSLCSRGYKRWSYLKGCQMKTGKSERARGAAWRIWDLHVHTPASFEQGYGGDNDEVWEKYINELEKLPEEIKVIGINDYWFLDGYNRVREAKEAGRLQNIDEIFPVIEMRLRHFGGSAGGLSRVNLHVIFDPELGFTKIQSQFVNALQSKVRLAPGIDGKEWSGSITKASLADLGKCIKGTVPKDQLSRYKDDLTEGFNNINVDLSDVLSALSSSYLRGRAIVGIGKTEWADIKWNDQSIAAKKDVINSASLVFTAYEDVARWKTDVEKLRNDGVTHRLLDCSDAHYFSDSKNHMRLGACQTWLNTTPTFAGLVYALEEFERRVYVGLEPPMRGRVRKNPDRFIDRVRVYSRRDELKLFQHDIPLNSGFVAIVGNKGQGKSALLDCIALGGNSSRNDEFAFLRKSRFLSSSNKKVAKEYQTHVTWADGTGEPVGLDAGYNSGAQVRVEYLPQMFVERICNNDSSDVVDEFEQELRAILFTHIPDDQRLGQRSFDDLFKCKTEGSDRELDKLRSGLDGLIRSYVEIAEFRAHNDEADVRHRLEVKRADIESAREDFLLAKEELEAMRCEDAQNADLMQLMQQSEDIERRASELADARAANEQERIRVQGLLTKLNAVAQRVDEIFADVESINLEVASLLAEEFGQVSYIELFVRREVFADSLLAVEKRLAALQAELNSIDSDVKICEDDKRIVDDRLAAADAQRERVRQRVLQLEQRVNSLIGSSDDSDSELGLQVLLDKIEHAPQVMGDCISNILKQSSLIHAALMKRLSMVEDLYAPASRFIAGSSIVSNAGLKFNAELRILPVWNEISAALDVRRNGDFSTWLSRFEESVSETSWEKLLPQLRNILERIQCERAEVGGKYRNPNSALRKSASLNVFLKGIFDLTWLEVRFGLTGNNRQLSELSPGQRGLVLALFYLVVDLRATPLLLDQPEENLDNETIASKLVPAIHEAAGRRQTIIVTHNANLAIVGDADQIIHCRMSNEEFSVSSGCIAELDIAKFALDVLEGTKPAFDNRRHKYEAFPELS